MTIEQLETIVLDAIDAGDWSTALTALSELYGRTGNLVYVWYRAIVLEGAGKFVAARDLLLANPGLRDIYGVDYDDFIDELAWWIDGGDAEDGGAGSGSGGGSGSGSGSGAGSGSGDGSAAVRLGNLFVPLALIGAAAILTSRKRR